MESQAKFLSGASQYNSLLNNFSNWENPFSQFFLHFETIFHLSWVKMFVDWETSNNFPSASWGSW